MGASASQRILIATLLLAAPCFACACTEQDVTRDVKDLGRWQDPQHNPYTDLACFAEHGQMAAGLLTQQLHTIPERDILSGEEDDHPDISHVLWSLRGLYYLTGINLRGGSADTLKKLKMDSTRRYWLLFQSGDQVNFFGTWSSHDYTAIAPQDIQADIIGKWKAWYAKGGATFAYKPHTSTDWVASGFDDRDGS